MTFYLLVGSDIRELISGTCSGKQRSSILEASPSFHRQLWHSCTSCSITTSDLYGVSHTHTRRSIALLDPIRRFARNWPTESTSFHLRLRRCSNLNFPFLSSSLAHSPAHLLRSLFPRSSAAHDSAAGRHCTLAFHTVPPNFRAQRLVRQIDLAKHIIADLLHSPLHPPQLCIRCNLRSRGTLLSLFGSSAQDCR